MVLSTRNPTRIVFERDGRLGVTELLAPTVQPYREGEQLFHKVSPYFKTGEQVQLDFSDVELASSSFFSELLGSIVENFGEEFLDKHLSFTSLKPRHKYVLDLTRNITPA